MALRNHLIHFDELIDLQNSRLRGLNEEFERDIGIIKAEFDTEKAVSFVRKGFRIVLWLMVVLSMYFNEWSQVIAAAVLLAVLELEEINQKME